MADQYDAIIVGTGFASSLFLHRLLEGLDTTARVLVLEAGRRHPHAWQLTHPMGLEKLARDWPIGYDDPEEYYCQTEELMAVAGPSDDSPFPRSRPYPLPAHGMSDPDKLLKRAFPDTFYAQSTARPSRAVPGKRPKCCNNGVCHLCPIDSKFTIENSMRRVYLDPRVRLETEALVQRVDTQNGLATGVQYLLDGREHLARGELVALGASALFNPHILMRSGLDHPELGRNLHE